MEPGAVFRFTVFGDAKPQGSKSAFMVTKKDPVTGQRVPVMKNGRPIINQGEKDKQGHKNWRQEVASAAALAYRPRWGLEPVNGPVVVALTFFKPRPSSDFKKNGALRDGAKLYPDTWTDIDKLERAVLDSMTGIVFTNDARVVTFPTRKRFGAPARCEVVVRRPRADTVGDLRRLAGQGDPRVEAELNQLALAVAS